MTANEARELNKGLSGLLIDMVIESHIYSAALEGKTECIVSLDEFPENITEDMVLNWIHVNGFAGGPVCDILPDPNFRGMVYGKAEGYIIRW